jgi:Ni,Fe-hydrogenase III small subunit/formate hydrogenlyase subunit 6/NADH:ubiquinone oxidoreductase subunit I
VFSILAQSLKTGIVTKKDPFSSRPPFGFPVIDFKACTACDECVTVCPTAALQTDRPADDRKTLTLSQALCIQCRACVEACPESAIHPGREFEVAAYSREQLTQRAAFDVDGATGRASFREMETLPGPSLEASAAKLKERIKGRLGRSLHVRQVDAGSCNGCELEIIATTNPVFDLERFGIHFVASPRHADVLLVTGPVTRNMEIALRRTYEATPEPRVVVAVGACGCSGGIFGDGTYASLGGVDRVLPVDVYVPGCPPRPHAVLNGLLVAMGLRQAHGGPGRGQTVPEPALAPGVPAARPPLIPVLARGERLLRRQ